MVPSARPTDWPDLMALHSAFEGSFILHTAVELDLFTHLAREEARVDGAAVPGPAVALAANTEPRATELLMDALAAMGYLSKEPPEDPEAPLPGGAFRTTPLVQRHLVEGAEADFRDFIRFDLLNRTKWTRLTDTIRTGEPPTLDHMHQGDPEALDRFMAAMEQIARARGDAAALVDRIDLSRTIHLLDVGGGAATYSLRFLERHPQLHVTLIDLPATLEVTQRYVAAAPDHIQRRIRLVPCDYTSDPLPAPPSTSSLPDELVERLRLPDELLPKLSEGYDVAWVSNILHGDTSDNNRALAAKLHDALRPGGRVIIKDHVLDSTMTRPELAARFSIHMLLTTRGGRDYTFDEIRRWYEDAGFVDLRETPPKAPLTSSLVTAKRPGGGLHEEVQRAAKTMGENVSGFLRAFAPRPPH